MTAVRIIVIMSFFLPSPFTNSMFSRSAATRLPATPNGMPIIMKKVLPKYCGKSGSEKSRVKFSNQTKVIGSERK